VPWVNVEPGPGVSQLPCTVHDPDVSVIVPPVPVIVTLVNVAVEALAVSVPVAVTTRFDPPVMARSAVESVPEIVRVLDTSMAVTCVTVPEIVRLKKP